MTTKNKRGYFKNVSFDYNKKSQYQHTSSSPVRARAEIATAGTASERVDLRGDLAARGRTGYDAAEATGADGDAETRQSHPGQPEGRQETAGGGGGDDGRSPTTGGSAKC